jgi:hypothetical protein
VVVGTRRKHQGADDRNVPQSSILLSIYVKQFVFFVLVLVLVLFLSTLLSSQWSWF